MAARRASRPDSEQRDCAILLFPPRKHPPRPSVNQSPEDFQADLDQFHAQHMINDESGRHFYTHVAVDCCGVRDDTPDLRVHEGCDIPPGERFTVDAEPKCGVRRHALAAWNGRAYARVAIRDLEPLGIRCPDFCERVNRLIGMPFSPQKMWSKLEKDPGGIVCADVITRCLDAKVQARIRKFLEAWVQTDYPTVRSRYPKAPVKPALALTLSNGDTFIAPNGYALAFGLPEGRTLKRKGRNAVKPNLKPLLDF